jgi:lysophospholipase L1-like esterase
VPLERRPFWSDDVKLAVDEVNTYIRTLASKQIIIFDAYSVLADVNGLMAAQFSADELHINTAGYDALNRALLLILKNALQSSASS